MPSCFNTTPLGLGGKFNLAISLSLSSTWHPSKKGGSIIVLALVFLNDYDDDLNGDDDDDDDGDGGGGKQFDEGKCKRKEIFRSTNY